MVVHAENEGNSPWYKRSMPQRLNEGITKYREAQIGRLLRDLVSCYSKRTLSVLIIVFGFSRHTNLNRGTMSNNAPDPIMWNICRVPVQTG